MIGALTYILTFVVLGSHIVLPWKLAAQPTASRRGWALLCLPSLFLVLLAGGWWLSSHPDALLGAGWGSRSISDLIVRSLAVTLPVLILVDTVLLVGWRKLEDLGWRLAAGLGLVATFAAGAFLELLRTGEGPWNSVSGLAVAAGTHLLVALAAGEVVTAFHRKKAEVRPLFAGLAAVSLPVYFYFLPPAVQGALWREGWGVTVLACALMFAVARWLPLRLRRPAVFAALLLWSIFLGIAGQVSNQLPDARTAPVLLPGVG